MSDSKHKAAKAFLESAIASERLHDVSSIACFPRMVDRVPEGSSGNVAITHQTIDRATSAALYRYAAACGGEENWILAPGDYCSLEIDGRCMMSDAFFEKTSNLRVVQESRGDVLIAGLGLGMILWPIAAKPEVRTITVLEYNPHVIALVKPHLPPKVRVIEADAFKWSGKCQHCFDTIYFDIWHTISYYAHPQMMRLHESYRRFLRKGGFMESWGRQWVEKAQAQLAERFGHEPQRFLRPGDRAALPSFATETAKSRAA